MPAAIQRVRLRDGLPYIFGMQCGGIHLAVVRSRCRLVGSFLFVLARGRDLCFRALK